MAIVTELAVLFNGERDPVCAACQRTCDDYDGQWCDYCKEFICSDCWLPGYDGTGDQCPVCGGYEYLGP